MDGVKMAYFKTAAQLFSERSFDAVSINDIAETIGKTKSSIYNHFSSKQEILDTMYRFFREHLFDNRKPVDELMPIIENGSVLDMMLSVTFLFPKEYMELLSNILAVIHQRKYHDEQAKRVAKELMVDEGVRYVEEVFDRAIAVGRLAPFNTHWLAIVLNDTRNGEYMRIIVDPDYQSKTRYQAEEMVVYQHAAAMIVDLRPPYRRAP